MNNLAMHKFETSNVHNIWKLITYLICVTRIQFALQSQFHDEENAKLLILLVSFYVDMEFTNILQYFYAKYQYFYP